MIQQETFLKVADNSGAKTVRCIKVLKQKSRTAKIGDFVIVSVKKAVKLKKKEIFKAIVVTTKFPFRKLNGFYLKFKENSVVLVDKQLSPIGTRINGLTLKTLKTKQNKLVVISKTLI